jgi:hypothetical protein
MMLCYLTGICHLSIVLVGARASILACWHSRSPDSSAKRASFEECQGQLDSFYRCLRVSEWVQGLGQGLFGPALLFTIWLMFDNHIYPVVIYVFTGILQLTVYFAGFWKVSWFGTMSMPIKDRIRIIRSFRRQPPV